MKNKTHPPFRALLLAAGLGTRLRPITNTIPKCLVEVGGKTLISRWLEHLIRVGCSDVIINTHYKSEQVKKYIEKNADNFSSLDMTLSHESQLLGTAGTLLKHKSQLMNGRVLMIHADNITDYDLFNLLDRHASRPSECLITMLLFRTDFPESCGIVELNSKGVVIDFMKK